MEYPGESQGTGQLFPFSSNAAIPFLDSRAGLWYAYDIRFRRYAAAPLGRRRRNMVEIVSIKVPRDLEPVFITVERRLRGAYAPTLR